MATKTPRIMFTPTPGVDLLLRRVARATDKPVARFVREFLDNVAPALTQLAEVLELSKESEEKAVTMLRNLAMGASAEAVQLGLQLEGDRIRLRQKKRVREAGSGVREAKRRAPLARARKAPAAATVRGQRRAKPRGKRSG